MSEKRTERTEKWNRNKVLRAILRYESSDQPMNAVAIKETAPTLYAAARRHFGSWSHALSCAGIKADLVAKKRQWTCQNVTHRIRELYRCGHTLKPGAVGRTEGGLYHAAVIHFGTWPNALLAAGLDAEEVCSSVVWDRDRIIEAILMRVVKGESLGSTTVRPLTLKAAAIEEFGGWAAALESAGLEASQYIGRAVRSSRIHGQSRQY